MICAGATVEDLDETAIENFRTKWIEKKGKKQLAALSKEQLLHDCGAITDEGITYAALILFGKNSSIIRYLPQAETIFEYRSSEASGPANQREEFKTGFLHAMIKSGNSSIYAMTNNITRKDFCI